MIGLGSAFAIAQQGGAADDGEGAVPDLVRDELIAVGNVPNGDPYRIFRGQLAGIADESRFFCFEVAMDVARGDACLATPTDQVIETATVVLGESLFVIGLGKSEVAAVRVTRGDLGELPSKGGRVEGDDSTNLVYAVLDVPHGMRPQMETGAPGPPPLSVDVLDDAGAVIASQALSRFPEAVPPGQ